MNASFLINLIFFLFALLGAADYLLDNRLGLGSQFEWGICCAGKLIIAMTGFMALSTVLGRLLAPVVTPLFTAMGADPSALAGMILANDSGGAALAAEMALDPVAGDFNGYFVASMLGGSAGYPLGVVLPNLIPASLLCFALFLVLLLLNRWIVRPFQLLGKLLVGVSLTGLLLTEARELFGIELVEGLNPFDGIIYIIGGIALVLSGVFPLLSVVSRLLRRPLARMAERLRVTDGDVSSLLVTAVNVFPTFELLNGMSPKGVLLNCAFMVGANCMLGDHFAFTSQTKPPLALPVLFGKAVAGFLALALALLLAPRLLDAPDSAGERGEPTSTTT